MNEHRLDELNVLSRDTKVNRGYSRFVKMMRIALPLSALVLTAIVITWPEMDDKIAVVRKDDIIPHDEQVVGENELLNPKFETTDAQQQPVNVTAVRALQNQENPNLIKLEKPNADLKMKDGSNVQIEAIQGTYEQEAEKLFLQDEVKVRHESGYELQAEELRVNMKTREAFSDKTVHVVGPKAQIDASGLKGNVDDGLLIFKGPAKLTLTLQEKDGTMGPDDRDKDVAP